jgi:hypothetical protein
VRNFVPFIKEVMQGHVTSLLKLGEEKTNATASIVQVDSGFLLTPGHSVKGMISMVDTRVVVDRSVYWVFGRCLHQVYDVAMILPKNIKVMIEAVEMSEEYKTTKYPSLPADVCYEASICWVGAARPRNEKRDPNLNDSRVTPWLKKKDLSMDMFERLLRGEEIGRHKRDSRDEDGFVLTEDAGMTKKNKDKVRSLLDSSVNYQAQGHDVWNQLQQQQQFQEEQCRTMQPPVLRHGRDVADVVEGAIRATGPEDPILNTLIITDEIAQKAHHISAALLVAVENFTNSQNGGGRGFGGFGGRPNSDSRPFSLEHPQQQTSPGMGRGGRGQAPSWGGEQGGHHYQQQQQQQGPYYGYGNGNGSFPKKRKN